MTTKTIKIPLYSGDLALHQVKDIMELNGKYNLAGLDGCDAVCLKDRDEDNHFIYVMAFQDNATPGIIAHECLHFVGCLFSDHHIIMDIDNDEPQAYLLEWAVNQCHKYLKIK